MKYYDKLIKNLTKLLVLSAILWGVFTIGCEGHENTVQLTEDELNDKLQNQYEKGLQEGKEKGLLSGYEDGYEDALKKTLGAWYKDPFEPGYYIVKIDKLNHSQKYLDLKGDTEKPLEHIWYIYSRTEMSTNIKYEVDESGKVWSYD